MLRTQIYIEVLCADGHFYAEGNGAHFDNATMARDRIAAANGTLLADYIGLNTGKVSLGVKAEIIKAIWDYNYDVQRALMQKHKLHGLRLVSAGPTSEIKSTSIDQLFAMATSVEA